MRKSETVPSLAGHRDVAMPHRQLDVIVLEDPFKDYSDSLSSHEHYTKLLWYVHGVMTGITHRGSFSTTYHYRDWFRPSSGW